MANLSQEKTARTAQAELDQMRHQAGGALTGAEARARAGLDPAEAEPDPPLDWRMTPRNVMLQLLAIALFMGAVWLMGRALFGGWGALWRHYGGGGA